MSFCYKTASVWKIVGNVFFILKIVIPILIIILASIDLGKAVISNDSKTVNESVNKLLKRLIAGVCIFFLPTIVRVVFNMISKFNDEMKEDYGNCVTCLTKPNECDTSYKGTIFK